MGRVDRVGQAKKRGLGQDSRSPPFKGRAEGEKPEKESGKEQHRDRKKRVRYQGSQGSKRGMDDSVKWN